jgi:hypothetical protein
MHHVKAGSMEEIDEKFIDIIDAAIVLAQS